MAPDPSKREARRATRRRTDAPSTLRASAAGPIDTIVADVSATGARISCETELTLGDAVTIGLAGIGAVRAVVVWKRDGHYGLDFITPLSPADADRAFVGGTVIRLGAAPEAATATAENADGGEEEEDGIYAESTGVLSALLITVAVVTAGAVAWMQGWF